MFGSTNPGSCNTGPDGLACGIVFNSREVGLSSQIVMIVEEGGGQVELTTSNRLNISVRGGPDLTGTIRGLGTTYEVIGQTDSHPNNHYCEPDFCSNLVELANEYNAEWDLRLAYNDTSLIKGGVFDISPASEPNWLPPHNLHRTGRDQDVRANDAPHAIPRDRPDIRAWFETRVADIFGRPPLLESQGTTNEHYHIFGG